MLTFTFFCSVIKYSYWFFFYVDSCTSQLQLFTNRYRFLSWLIRMVIKQTINGNESEHVSNAVFTNSGKISSSRFRNHLQLICRQTDMNSMLYGDSLGLLIFWRKQNHNGNYDEEQCLQELCKNINHSSPAVGANQRLHLFGMCLQHFIRSSPQHVLNLFWPFFATAGKHMVHIADSQQLVTCCVAL